MTAIDRPLEGITVVALEHAVAAPFASRQLADLGARVIKIEHPQKGDFARFYDNTVYGESSFFVWANAGKESLALDLKKPDEKAVLLELLSSADVFIQNMAPGVTHRLGLDFNTLKTTNPHLIMCNISGYGDKGELALKKSYDLLIQCASGLVNITGTAAEQARVGIPIADIAAGMYAFTGIMAGLLQRYKKPEPIEITISMLEALLEWMGYPLLYTEYGKKDIARLALEHPTIAPYGKYLCANNEEIILGLQNDTEWVVFVEQVLERPHLLQDARFSSNIQRVEHRAALDEIIQSIVATYDIDALTTKLDDARIANSPINAIKDLYKLNHLKQRNRWQAIKVKGQQVQRLIPPFLATPEAWPASTVPELGAHNKAIYAELGITSPTN